MKPILQPVSDQRLGDLLKAELLRESPGWTSFHAAVAFVKRSGVQHISESLQIFSNKGGHVRFVIGIDQYGTSFEGLADLSATVGEQGEIWINHDESSYVTFHPKLYLFENETSALLIIGSGNLTEGGLYTNDEAFSVNALDLTVSEHVVILEEVQAAFKHWCNGELATAKRLDAALLQELSKANYVKPEAEMKERRNDAPEQGDETGEPVAKIVLFGRGVPRHRPTRKRLSRPKPELKQETLIVATEEPRGFVMTLMRTDVGAGQTTPGTSRRSPEIFIPLAARALFPEFWNWPGAFNEDPAKPGKFDRSGVLMRIGGAVVSVNMMTWPDKHDFRLRSEALRSAGQVGDILRIEKTSDGQEFAYYVEIVPAGTSAYQLYLSLCSHTTRNSQKQWGYYS